jgi:hypothetical protein
MKRTLLLGCSTVLILIASPTFAGRNSAQSRPAPRVSSAANRGGSFVGRNAMTTRNWSGARNWNGGRSFNNSVSRNRLASRNWNTSRNFSGSRHWNGNWRRHCNRNRVVFFSSFGYPFFGYGYGYPYDYYPYYGYSSYYPTSYDNTYYDNAQPAYDYNNTEPTYADNGSYGARGRGSIVIEVQRRLARDGFYKGAVDGVMGSRTHYAIRAYKRSHGLTADGEIDDQLLGTMGLR